MKKIEMAITVEIITPNQVICSEEVSSLTVDTTMGEIEILPMHRPLITLLEVGSARLKLPNGLIKTIATSSGILKLENDRAVLTVEEAVNVHGLCVASSVEEARILAKNALETTVMRGNLEQNELERLEAKVRSELTKRLSK
ncbi:MAG: ATP synthase F1 subunit epsilon [Puniceicoccales bacterium]|jgi:F-type H+-transporting ATPase subunit epsilon|nr:ATP synthase F1 subunit epsilon [Puniceicoccales bacterium]